MSALPSTDLAGYPTWTQEETDKWAKYPYYLIKGTTAYRQNTTTWSKFFGKRPWTPNMGPTMKEIIVEDSPIQRQMAFPNSIQTHAKVDMPHIRQREVETSVYWHKFMSPQFHFLPSYQDFIKMTFDPYRKTINKQQVCFEEMYYRAHMFHRAPYVYICGATGGIDALSGLGNAAGTSGKTNAWLQAEVLPEVTDTLTLKHLWKALGYAMDTVGVTPFEGSSMPTSKWSEPLNERYGIIGDPSLWRQWVDDPWLKENKSINMETVMAGLKGDFWGLAKFRSESYPLRIKADNNFAPSWPAPEEFTEGGPLTNRKGPAADYSTGAQYGVAWLVGGDAYEIVNPGPAPSDFAGKDENALMGMDWNGKIHMTSNFLTEVQDENGNLVQDTNSWGEYRRLQATNAYGIIGSNIQNIIPIFYLRKSNLETAT